MDIKYPYYLADISVGRYEIRGIFDGDLALDVMQSVIPETFYIDGKEVVLESFSVNENNHTYKAKIDVKQNFIPLIPLAAILVGGGIFLNQANTTIDRVSRLAIISVPIVISVLTFLIIVKR